MYLSLCYSIEVDVALALGRLGVARIILADNDCVEASNLSRQCLSTRDQVYSIITPSNFIVNPGRTF